MMHSTSSEPVREWNFDSKYVRMLTLVGFFFFFVVMVAFPEARGQRSRRACVGST